MLQRGILSITDPRGKYMGEQTTARAFLLGRDIDISYLGPKEHPTAVVIAFSDVLERNQPDQLVTYIKADYFKYSGIEMFRLLLSMADSHYRFNRLMRNTRNPPPYRSIYCICYNNGRRRDVTKEEFFQAECDFEHMPEDPPAPPAPTEKKVPAPKPTLVPPPTSAPQQQPAPSVSAPVKKPAEEEKPGLLDRLIDWMRRKKL